MIELSLIVDVTLTLTIVLAACRAGRRWTASIRALILACGFAVLLALPLAALTVSPRTIAVPIPPGIPALAQARSNDVGRIVTQPARSGDAPRSVAEPMSSRWPRPLVMRVARTIWTFGALVLTVRLAASAWRVRQMRRRGIAWVARGGGIPSPPRGVAFFLSEDLASPMTCGLFRPAIGFPSDAPTWDAADRHRAMTHELEHVRRRDWLIVLLAEVTCALYWFHPLVWQASRRFRLEAEHACDDAVVSDAGHADYAQQLVSMARRLATANAAVLLPSMVDHSSLSTRVQAVLDLARPRGPVPRSAAAITVAVAIVFGGALASVRLEGQAPNSDVLDIPTSIGGPPFETVTIHAARVDDGPARIAFYPERGRLIARRQTLRSLIAHAYAPTPSLQELSDARLVGGPEWMNTDEFTIEATTRGTITARELQTTLRRLLTTYFNLAVHVDTHDTPAYRLVRGASTLGPRLRPARPECVGPIIDEGNLGEFNVRCTTMAALSASIHLNEVLGRPVVDRTSLAGAFDVSLQFIPTREELTIIYELPPDTELSSEIRSRPTIFAAFEQQLGLKLEPTQASLQVLAVDGASRPVLTP